MRDLHGFAILYDCHSIRSEIPFLFDGTLPDFNIGTNDGATCDPAIEAAVLDIATATRPIRSRMNQRFKGGWTTRHYGRPTTVCTRSRWNWRNRAYLTAETPPWTYDPAKCRRAATPRWPRC